MACLVKNKKNMDAYLLMNEETQTTNCLYLLPINHLIFLDAENGFLFTKINRGVFKDSGNVFKKRVDKSVTIFFKDQSPRKN